MTNIEIVAVAINAATGKQGREVIKRFQDINENKHSQVAHILMSVN